MRVVAMILMACSMAAQTGDYERARQLLTSGRAAEAAAIYRKLSRAQPDSPDLLLNLSIAEYKARDFRAAAESAAAALKLKPDLLPARLFLGASYLELRDYAKAIDSLEGVVAADPQDRNARLMLGEAMLGARRFANAVEHLQAAARMLAANSRVWYALGRAQEALGQKEAARKAWERLAALPPSLESHLHAAEMHTAEHRWSDAAVEYREALNVAPENRDARVGLSWSLFRGRDYDGVIAALKPLLKDESAVIQFLYGASLVNRQQPAEAIPYLRAAVSLDAAMLPARAALGQCLLQTGHAEEAIPLLEDAVSVDEDGSIHFQLFRAYQSAGRKTEAEQALGAYQRIRASLAAQP